MTLRRSETLKLHVLMLAAIVATVIICSEFGATQAFMPEKRLENTTAGVHFKTAELAESQDAGRHFAGVRHIAEVAGVQVGPSPIWGAYDNKTGYVYVVNSNDLNAGASGSVTVVQNTTVLATIPAGIVPISAALDTRNGLLYVPNVGSNNVTVINQTSWVGSVALTFSAQFANFDPQSGLVYMLDSNGTNLTIINGTTILATVQVGLDPIDAVYDSSNGFMYVTNSGSSNVSVLNGSRVIGQIYTGGYPLHPTYDSVNGCVYVPLGGSNVSVIRGLGVIANLDVGFGPAAVTYSATFDSLNGDVYVVDTGVGQVSIVRNFSVLGAVQVGASPFFATLDPRSGEVYVPNQGGANLSVIHGSSLNQTVSTGRHPWLAVYDAAHDQVDVVSYGSNELDVLRLVTAFGVAFTESGLAAGTVWSAMLGGSINSSSSNQIGFSAPNGSFSFILSKIYGYSVLPSNGTLVVNGTNESLAVTFTPISPPPTFSITFNEAGLPPNSLWWVQGAGSARNSSTAATIVVEELNGTYQFSIGTSNRAYEAPNVTVQIVGTSVDKEVSFLQILFSVSFVEIGLPSGSSWTVTLNHSTGVGVGTISFSNLANGSYSFVITPIFNYSGSPASGTATVSGGSIIETIQFSEPLNQSGVPPPPPPPPLLLYAALILGAVLLTAGGAFAYLRRRGEDGDECITGT